MNCKLIVAGLLLAAVSACSVVGTRAAAKVADAVDEYCEREPYPARQLYRNSVNAELVASGHAVEVTCAGDPEE